MKEQNLRPRRVGGNVDALLRFIGLDEEDRKRILVEQWVPDNQEAFESGEAARAASVYANPEVWNIIGHGPAGWPWEPSEYKPDHPVLNYARAVVLLMFEIERLQGNPVSVARAWPFSDKPLLSSLSLQELHSEISRMQNEVIRRVCGSPIEGVGLRVGKEEK
jgi:hypothetical protein